MNFRVRDAAGLIQVEDEIVAFLLEFVTHIVHDAEGGGGSVRLWPSGWALSV